MKLTAEQISGNWDILINSIKENVSEPRRTNLLNFYNKYSDRLVIMPAAHKKEYHNCFPGGYVEHVNRVVRCAIKQSDLWEDEGADMTTFTREELIFSAINHDLGKMGDETQDSYIPQDDKWRRDKLGEDYKFNEKVPFASVPDRGLFLLQSHGVTYTFNEMLAIQTHDGLYDDANKKYLMSWSPGQKPRTSLPFILHQADMMAARIEFEREWLPKLRGEEENLDKPKKNSTLTSSQHSTNTKNKALHTVGSNKLKDLLDKI